LTVTTPRPGTMRFILGSAAVSSESKSMSKIKIKIKIKIKRTTARTMIS